MVSTDPEREMLVVMLDGRPVGAEEASVVVGAEEASATTEAEALIVQSS